jgi:hypothetical protein
MYEVCFVDFRKKQIKQELVRLMKKLFKVFLNLTIAYVLTLFVAFLPQLAGTGEALFAVTTEDSNLLLL